jgi:hypothetical protein
MELSSPERLPSPDRPAADPGPAAALAAAPGPAAATRSRRREPAGAIGRPPEAKRRRVVTPGNPDGLQDAVHSSGEI